jgi:hypothetical protein
VTQKITTQIGVFRPSTGKWYLDVNHNARLSGVSPPGVWFSPRSGVSSPLRVTWSGFPRVFSRVSPLFSLCQEVPCRRALL